MAGNIGIGTVTRPATGTGARARSLRKAGLVLAAIGVGITSLALLASLSAGSLIANGGAPDQVATSLILAFGLATAGFASLKFGIGVILLGIVRRLWVRIEAVRWALPALVRARYPQPWPLGAYESAQGPASATRTAPKPLAIHRMAQLLWAPMLAMGALLVAIGFLVDVIGASRTGSASGAGAEFAWAQGLMFLGEAALLSGISFLLGTILAAIRAGGGEVQESMGLTVKTLRMPDTGKIFVGLMMAGLMTGIAQFIGYLIVAGSSDPADLPAAFAALGPLREFALGLLLAGIVLALATIGKALRFQFDRIIEIIYNAQ